METGEREGGRLAFQKKQCANGIYVRICPGRHFAEMGLFLTIASVLHVFDISPPLDKDGRPVQLQPKMSYGGLSYVSLSLFVC